MGLSLWLNSFLGFFVRGALGSTQQAILIEEMELEERISELYIDLKRS
ncbi:MAG: hypothetical protein U9N49_08750 [Campylobacterota bacterium]|nr:hypothetical protein [Campylobacterota bacterium]